jgi:hypothetical protein
MTGLFPTIMYTTCAIVRRDANGENEPDHDTEEKTEFFYFCR